MARTIVVGADGSQGSDAATRWCAELASTLEAEVVVVHGIALDAYPSLWMMLPAFDDTWRKELLSTMENEWCKPLEQKGVPFRVEVVEDSPAQAVMSVADREHADMIVVGRRGRGGFTELVLGSVSHRLAHHAHQPVVIVPHAHKDG